MHRAACATRSAASALSSRTSIQELFLAAGGGVAGDVGVNAVKSGMVRFGAKTMLAAFAPAAIEAATNVSPHIYAASTTNSTENKQDEADCAQTRGHSTLKQMPFVLPRRVDVASLKKWETGLFFKSAERIVYGSSLFLHSSRQ